MLLLVSVRGYAIRIVLLCIAITLPALSGAEDLAQGHHLWTVATANSGKTFIAAGTYATDSRADVILNRQIKAIGNVKLVALSSDGRGRLDEEGALRLGVRCLSAASGYHRLHSRRLGRAHTYKAGTEPHRGLGDRRSGRIVRPDRDASTPRIPDHTASAA